MTPETKIVWSIWEQRLQVLRCALHGVVEGSGELHVGRIVPVEKKAAREWSVPAGETHGARDGELVEAQQSGPKSRMGLPRARIVARLGDPTAPVEGLGSVRKPAFQFGGGRAIANHQLGAGALQL